MKKQIRDCQVIKEMTYEEVLRRYKPMMVHEVKKHTSMVLFNGVEHEDLMQELSVALWKAYNDYDISFGTDFATYCYNILRDGKKRATQHCFAKKRTAKRGSFSLDDYLTYSDGGEEEEHLMDEFNLEESYIDQEFVDMMYNNLDEMSIDVLKILVAENTGFRADKKAFATKWNMSRPTAYKRIAKITYEIQEFVLDNGYML